MGTRRRRDCTSATPDAAATFRQTCDRTLVVCDCHQRETLPAASHHPHCAARFRCSDFAVLGLTAFVLVFVTFSLAILLSSWFV
jgi:hypothetical protein